VFRVPHRGYKVEKKDNKNLKNFESASIQNEEGDEFDHIAPSERLCSRK